MQLMALRKKAEGSAPPERKPGRRLTVRRGAALWTRKNYLWKCGWTG